MTDHPYLPNKSVLPDSQTMARSRNLLIVLLHNFDCLDNPKYPWDNSWHRNPFKYNIHSCYLPRYSLIRMIMITKKRKKTHYIDSITNFTLPCFRTSLQSMHAWGDTNLVSMFATPWLICIRGKNNYFFFF